MRSTRVFLFLVKTARPWSFRHHKFLAVPGSFAFFFVGALSCVWSAAAASTVLGESRSQPVASEAPAPFPRPTGARTILNLPLPTNPQSPHVSPPLPNDLLPPSCWPLRHPPLPLPPSGPHGVMRVLDGNGWVHPRRPMFLSASLTRERSWTGASEGRAGSRAFEFGRDGLLGSLVSSTGGKGGRGSRYNGNSGRKEGLRRICVSITSV